VIAAVLLATACTLPAGPHQTGFRTSYVLDQGRPVIVKLWYPAADTTSARLFFRDYLTAPELPGFRGLAGRFSHFMRRRAVREMLNARTPSCRECAPAAGRFPVVVYYPGADGTFAENTVLFETLASHGYVVITSLYPSGPRHLSNNRSDAEAAIRDMRALLMWSRSLPWADVSRVGAIGHSMGAQIFLEWLGQADMPIDALVSLDSTLEYTPRDFPGHRELRGRLAVSGRPTIPVLLFARADDIPPNFRSYDEFLSQATRYEAAVRYLEHDDFTMAGAYRRNLPQVRDAYEHVCRSVLAFLDCSLKADAARCAAVKSSGPITISVRQPI
jgi:dienelactone hydrolase